MVTLEDAIRQFSDFNHVVLATVKGRSPRLRPMTMVRHGDSFYFATGINANKVKQLESNPDVEILLQWKEEPNNGYIRLDGKVVKETSIEIVTELYEKFDYFSKLWQGPDDPALVVYRVKVRHYDYMKPGEWASVKIEVK
jgi:general stress protein 26